MNINELKADNQALRAENEELHKRVAQLQRASEALQGRLALEGQREAMLSAVAEATPHVMYVYDFERQEIIWSNTSVFETIGFTLEQVNTESEALLAYLFEPDDQQRVIDYILSLRNLEDGVIKEFEYHIRHAEGHWRWFLSRDKVFKRSASGQVQQIIGSVIEVDALKKAEQEKTEALAFVESITTAIPDVVMIYDHKAQSLVWHNRYLMNALGYRQKDIDRLLASPDEEVTAPDSPTTFQHAIEIMQGVADAEVRSFDYKFISPDGSPRWYKERSVVYQRGVNGHVHQHIGVFTDITEQVLAEQELYTRATKLNQAQHLAKLGHFTLDINTGVAEWSTSLYEILGYDPGEPIDFAKVISDIHHPEDKERVQTWLREGLQSGSEELPALEYRVLRKDGEVIYVRTQGVIERLTGQGPMIYATLQDITAMRKAQEDLRYQAFVLRSISDAVITTDLNFIVNGWNKAAEKLYGYTAKEAKGQSVQELLQRRDVDTTLAEVKNALESKGSWSGESVQTAKGGHEVLVTSAISLVFSEEGQAIGSVGVHHDLSERIKGEYEARQREELSRTNEALEQFAYIASHDLQEPLRTISNYTNLIVEEYQDQFDELGQKSLGFIIRATERMSVLITDLLSYSRIGRNLRLEPIDLNQLVHDIRLDLTAIITETAAAIEIEKLPQVKGFKTELRLLLQNLISNALKFRCTNCTPRIKISSHENDNFWYIAVKDNGIGIAEQYQERIFNLFQRLHNQRDYQGTGIGLAQCKRIAELHGGEIWVESTPGKGSTFGFGILKSITLDKSTAAP